MKNIFDLFMLKKLMKSVMMVAHRQGGLIQVESNNRQSLSHFFASQNHFKYVSLGKTINVCSQSTL
jgi:hypothetical protein